jgi:hypothetical protein
MEDQINKIIASLDDEIENQNQAEDSRELEEFKELIKKVTPKMIVASRELTELTNIFGAFWDKHQYGGRTVFFRTLEFYMDALKFDPLKILAGLTEEIAILKR